MTESPKDAAALIIERLDQNFKPTRGLRYRIYVVNDVYDDSYNFFLDIKSKYTNERSIPLHSLEEYTLEYLERVIRLVEMSTQMTIEFQHFEGLRWPVRQRLIK
ncbi:acetyl-CoA carboxylase [Paucilactobacillus suebicus]|uniref:Acetyl-CoA carboxylase carboxyltransferase subunit n=1 Tax=Paucilactobacillus suebicus DSM 5007 = KCTC 3549 TaxID=1423807 RepID=A0A0R1W636_9LACO|nr:hypothetical protein [Paucilactobacillus suebicus]KRM10790.1 acetyl-CoA carboxylase carboxyltransferase subunit [Paucilactobacillus suebicus DSM 5007 = KCTC 3549]